MLAKRCVRCSRMPDVPKSVHDYKAAIHALEPLGITLAGVQHDPMLYSYLLDPTYSSHRLADVALRRFNLKLGGQARRIGGHHRPADERAAQRS